MRRQASGNTGSANRAVCHGVLVGVLLLAGTAGQLVGGQHAYAQAAAKADIADTWQGTLHAERDLRIVLKVTRAPNGALKSTMYSLDQGGEPIPVRATAFSHGELSLDVEVLEAKFTGKLSADGSALTGELEQGNKPLPLNFARATPETAWTIPEPPPRVPPMKADADPSFEVATIKPSRPDDPGKGFGGPPGHFMTRNTTVNDLMMYAYNVHTRQILGGPAWFGTEKFDIEAKPDTPGAATDAQNRIMTRKLLATRFGLKYHTEKRELSAFILGVAKGGPKLERSDVDPNLPAIFQFRDLGNLVFGNLTMPDFASWLQTVLDRPVVDHTGLTGRFGGRLKWNPDETQFAVFGPPPHPSTAPDAPPPLYTAIQQQIGLKLDAAKTPVDVMVVDHVEQPSDN